MACGAALNQVPEAALLGAALFRREKSDDPAFPERAAFMGELLAEQVRPELRERRER